MSISTTGGEQRRPGVVSTGKKAPGEKAADTGGAPSDASSGGSGGGAKPAAAKAGAKKPAATKPAATKAGAAKAGAAKAAPAKAGAAKARPKGAGGGKGGPRRPVAPVKVHTDRSWGPIALFAAVGLLAVGIIGYGAYAVWNGARSWEDRAGSIDGIVNYREKDPKILVYEKHTAGPLKYTVNPPVGGNHNNDWMNCMGDVYDAPIANEHAVHSLEHGAVWITYRPDLPKDQVDTLAAKVRGTEKMFMSPYEGLDTPISLQAWGYQLKVDNASDGRINDFIKALRVNASTEGPNALCNQGITETGTTPRDLPRPQQ
jgi:Protein of unknown function (DUF3105)